MEQRSVRFSTKKPVEHESTYSFDWDLEEDIKKILRLPLPKIINDINYNIFDVHTACSLGISGKDIPEISLEWEKTLNIENAHKWTPLMYSAYLGHPKLCEEILSKVYGVDTVNESMQTALMLAASCGSVDTVKVLVKYGADINRQDYRGWSSLHYSIYYNQSAITEMLLETGADPNIPDKDGMTPVLIACEVGSEATVSTLIKYKGDPNLKNHRGENGEVIAAEFPKILKLIKNQPTLDGILKQLSLEKYIPIFERDEITLNLFLNLTEKDLTDMGITLFGPRKKLINVIKQYKERGSISVDPELKASAEENQPDHSGIENSLNLKMEDDLSTTGTKTNKKILFLSMDIKCLVVPSELDQVKNELSRAKNLISFQQKELQQQLELNAYMHRLMALLCEKLRKDNFDPRLKEELEKAVNKLTSSIGRLKNFT